MENTSCWWGYEASGILMHYEWEYKIIQLLWKTALKKKKLNIHMSYDPATPLLGIYLWEMKKYVHKKPCTWMFNLLYSFQSQTRSNPNIHQGEWLNKNGHSYHWMLLIRIKQQTAVKWNDMDESQNCAELKKPSQKGDILYYNTYIKCN